MGWPHYLMNPEALSRLFNSIEELDSLNVFEVSLKRDGPVVALRADLPRFPEHPSRRWPPGANRVQVWIEFIGVEALSLTGFDKDNSANLEVAPMQAGYSFMLRGPAIVLSGQCECIRIAGVSAYIDEEAVNNGMERTR
ncbi:MULTISPECIES: Imm50 family immunity protein [Halomonadaceae]|uniref:Uncharacterized protein n=1 Tax=Billgrantia aerodenitrificans TaxID=2733483 RepID=A0ABS9AUS2_9GAMM|nr:hypothetical protein [Halomonas aerodenitrificans]MCE8038298.1 hypothetical protein [Halomonas sp. MCCC 1A11062]